MDLELWNGPHGLTTNINQLNSVWSVVYQIGKVHMRLINQYLGDLIKSLLSIDEKLKFLVSEYVALIFAYILKGNTFQLVVIFSVI